MEEDEDRGLVGVGAEALRCRLGRLNLWRGKFGQRSIVRHQWLAWLRRQLLFDYSGIVNHLMCPLSLVPLKSQTLISLNKDVVYSSQVISH